MQEGLRVGAGWFEDLFEFLHPRGKGGGGKLALERPLVDGAGFVFGSNGEMVRFVGVGWQDVIMEALGEELTRVLWIWWTLKVSLLWHKVSCDFSGGGHCKSKDHLVRKIGNEHGIAVLIIDGSFDEVLVLFLDLVEVHNNNMFFVEKRMTIEINLKDIHRGAIRGENERNATVDVVRETIHSKGDGGGKPWREGSLFRGTKKSLIRGGRGENDHPLLPIHHGIPPQGQSHVVPSHAIPTS